MSQTFSGFRQLLIILCVIQKHTHTHTAPSLCCTLPDSQGGGVDQEQQDVVEEALEHGRVGVEVNSQVLAGQTDGTDQQGQDLTQGEGHQQVPAGRGGGGHGT